MTASRCTTTPVTPARARSRARAAPSTAPSGGWWRPPAPRSPRAVDVIAQGRPGLCEGVGQLVVQLQGARGLTRRGDLAQLLGDLAQPRRADGCGGALEP